MPFPIESMLPGGRCPKSLKPETQNLKPETSHRRRAPGDPGRIGAMIEPAPRRQAALRPPSLRSLLPSAATWRQGHDHAWLWTVAPALLAAVMALPLATVAVLAL